MKLGLYSVTKAFDKKILNNFTINFKDGFNKKTLEDILDVIRKVC